MSLLRITLRLIVGVDIHIDYAESGPGVIRCRSPRNSLTSLSSSSAVHRQFACDPGASRPLSLSPPY
jgi:hypothetical protein